MASEALCNDRGYAEKVEKESTFRTRNINDYSKTLRWRMKGEIIIDDYLHKLCLRMKTSVITYKNCIRG